MSTHEGKPRDHRGGQIAAWLQRHDPGDASTPQWMRENPEKWALMHVPVSAASHLGVTM